MLDGSVRQAGDELRVTLQLIHLESEESRWSERYTGALDDLFGIQEEVARSVAEALTLQFSSTGEENVRGRGIEDTRAMESYLRARYETWKFSRDGLQAAERHLKNGMEIVGDNALLFASLGHAYANYAQLGIDPEGAYLEQAAACAERVFDLEPDSSRGHFLQGLVRFHSGDLRSARAPPERPLVGRPNDPDILAMLGYLSTLCGQHTRASDLFQRALDVDPLTPLNIALPGFLASSQGRQEDALYYYRKYRDIPWGLRGRGGSRGGCH